jgi:hypothetical protein
MRDTMANEDQRARPAALPRLVALALVVTLLLAAVLAAVLVNREGDSNVAAPILTPSTEASPTTTTADTRTEVVERLRKILRIRDKAFRDRNAGILDEVYTVDCPCLEGDRNAIEELADNNYHIVGGTTSIRVRQVNSVSERLWLVTADFRSAPLRIEAESNKLIREEPGGSDLFQFVLSKPSGSHDWLLDQATAYRDGSG